MKKLISGLLFLTIFITACNQTPSQSGTDGASKTIVQYNNEAKLKMELPISKSPIKGITNDSTITIDYNNMEKELTDISRSYVNTKKVIFSPGQILTSEDAQNLLGRESEATPLALNPAKKENLKDSPIYANTLIEQDFFEYDGDEKKYDMVSIGIGINPKYTYGTGEKDVYEIKDEEIKDYLTKELSRKVITYLRQEKGIKSQILVGFYKESTNATLPGSYLTYGVAKEGENSLEEVKVNQVEYKIFPDASNEQQSDINEAINTLQTKLSAYFSDYSSATAIGRFNNGKLEKIDIEVNVNNYSSAEIDQFISYVEDNSKDLLKYTGNVDYQFFASGGKNVGLLTFSDGNRSNRYVYSTN